MKSVRLLFHLFLISILSGCATTEGVRRGSMVDCERASSLAVYAAMSSNAYERAGKGEPLFGLSDLGWHKVDLQGRAVTSSTHSYSGSISGLAFDIWEHSDGRTVFAFRGSDSPWDYVVANSAVPFSIQYKSANKKFRDYIEGRESVVVATGHSLGGGLALSVSARNPNVEAVVFNASPRVFDGLGNKPPAATRILVYQQDEALIGARRAWSWKIDELVPVENRFYTDFAEDNHGSHSMALMALGLIKAGAPCSQDVQRLKSSVSDAFFEGLE